MNCCLFLVNSYSVIEFDVLRSAYCMFVRNQLSFRPMIILADSRQNAILRQGTDNCILLTILSIIKLKNDGSPDCLLFNVEVAGVTNTCAVVS